MRKKIMSLVLVICVISAFLPYANAASPKVKDVVSGAALLDDGSVWTWGDFSGHGTIEGSETPQELMQDIKEIYTYGTVHYALKTDGSLWGWGSGWIGGGTDDNVLTPVKIADDVKTMCGPYYILKTDNSLWGWGDYVGDGTDKIRLSPVKIADNVKSFYRSAARFAPKYIIKTDNSLWGWGKHGYVDKDSNKNNVYIGVGDGTDETRLSPVKIMDNVKKVKASGNESTFYYYDQGQRYSYRQAYSVYAITNDNVLWSWGLNYNGELADGTNQNKLSPVQIMTNVKDIEFDESDGTTFQWYIIKTNNTLFGWGSNDAGELGIGQAKAIETPTKIMDNVDKIYPYGIGPNFVKKTDNSFWCWGRSAGFSLGTGTENDCLIAPKKILDNVVDFQLSFAGYCCAVKSDNTLWLWGRTDSISYKTPTQFANNVNKCIHPNYYCSYIIKNDGSLWAWGYADYLGIGEYNEEYVYTPIQVKFATSPDPLPEKSFTVSGKTVTNTASTSQTATVIVADYTNGKLTNVKSQNLTFAAGESKTFTYGSGTTHKIFVWNSLKGMYPMVK